jgi:hypothetical protein
MRRYLGIIITVVIMLLVLIGLNAVSFVRLDRPKESESDPNRSSYNVGPTGARAFYQLLEESGYQVERWRGSYAELEFDAPQATLVMIGPGDSAWLDAQELSALKAWVARGGHLVIISRQPETQFDHASIRSQVDAKAIDEINADPTPENLIDQNSDLLIAQPTELTRNTRGVEFSRLAARLKFEPTPTPSPTTPGITQRPSRSEDEEPPPPPPPAKNSDDADDEAMKSAASTPVFNMELTAPVVHLGDSKGAVLADHDYGAGRVIFLSDPFIVANNGIARGSNLTLALNLINAVGGKERKLFFDEAMHGYQKVSNPLLTYFRGTPALWIFGQGLLIALLIAWSAGRRFARPLPLPQPGRHSPLEFVDSMASLQQAARAHDLALENIYPRFRTRLCRRLGLSVKAKPEEIALALSRRRTQISADEVRRTMIESERALAGAELDDQRLMNLVATMRRINAQFR